MRRLYHEFSHLQGVFQHPASGEITEYLLPTAGVSPNWITAGPDGAVWFTEYDGNKIGRITIGAVITEYAIPTQGSSPSAIAVGRDGALWFTELGASNIGRITTTGVITEYAIPSGGLADGITAGPDGALWFADGTLNTIGRVTAAGVITEYPIPTSDSGPQVVTGGPDGGLWFTEWSGNKIGRAPACGLAFSASFANGTLTTKFVLGINTPAIFGITVHTSTGWQNLFSKPLQPIVPPKAFAATWSFPNEGNVTVKSAVTTTNWQELCSEWTTVSTAP